MKTNMATDRSQSDRLLRCGVSADTADMCYDSGALSLMDYDSAVHERDSRRESYEVVPAWSLSRLLGLLPKRIKRGDCSDYTLNLSCDGCFWDLGYTYARYRGEDDSLVLFEDKDPKEVCVKTIEWLTANGYKLNEI